MYGRQMRSHAEMLSLFGAASVQQQQQQQAPTPQFADGEQFARAALPLLERVEDRLALWKRQKWEFRTPALLSPDEKVAATALLRKLQATAEGFGEKRRAYLEDSALAASILGVSIDEMRLQPRAWLQKRVAALRMQGRSEDAKHLREAWTRMEELGGPDYDLLERLVLAYGLGKMGTFDMTFRNTICLAKTNGSAEMSGIGADSADAVSHNSGLLKLDESDPLTDLLGLVLTHIPDIHILYDFLGWNNLLPHSAHAEQTSYAQSLGEYMARCLHFQHGSSGVLAPPSATTSSTAEPTLLYSNNASKVYLMRNPPQNLGLDDVRKIQNSSANITKASSAASYALWSGPTLTIIQQAHPNKFLRQRQLPNPRQLEGMCRRSAFVLGHQLEDVRARTLLLPPSSMDRRSLLRLHAALNPKGSIATLTAAEKKSSTTTTTSAEHRAAKYEAQLYAAEMSEEHTKRIPPEFRGWVSLYRSDLSSADADYAAVSQTKPEEEWFTL